MSTKEIGFESNRIRELRIELGFSQRQLAAKTGINQANISRWESGDTVPNVLDCWKLALLFDISIDYLIGKCDY
jgi:transcriptional regulator with XRE-family HTH domain